MADGLELSQVRMKITDDPDVLTALHRRKRFQKDPDGKGEYISVMFNSQEIKFRLGQVKTLGKSVAESIYRREWVIITNPGVDDLTGEIKTIFEIVDEYSLSDIIEAKTDSFICPVPSCRVLFKSAGSLGHHLMVAHKDLKSPAQEKKLVAAAPVNESELSDDDAVEAGVDLHQD